MEAEKAYTKKEIEEIMHKAFLNLIEEAEEWGNGQEATFYHYSTGASAMIYHISKVLEDYDERE